MKLLNQNVYFSCKYCLIWSKTQPLVYMEYSLQQSDMKFLKLYDEFPKKKKKLL